ncbi:PTS cellobiose transporter subunit IIA [Lactobacillus apis]|uniref:PTS cellobiose transporter subunit IIA n=1 Tax=Lactobacillus apis TaxID=303541 RepID=UPI002740390F|nr:PTS cellobiose transporter subunit IIA [Lactobacillus apis]WLS85250.1 PTS cellobiose transporter subunit IIA [Lactobacillus apis]
MSDNSQPKTVEQKRHADSIKYLYFSRYLMLRYSVVIFLFVNLFWFLILIQYRTWVGIVLSGLVTLFSAAAGIEQLTKMHNRKPDVPVTRYYFWTQIGLNLILAICLFIPMRKQLFPFVTNSDSLYLMLAFLFAEIILAYICERRIHNIIIGKDKYKKLIETYKKAK